MLLFGLPPGPSRAEEPGPPPSVLERTIPLPGVSGRIDHLAVDLRRGRLFVAELGNGSLGVIDLASSSVTHRITGLQKPQGVGYVPGGDLVAVASGDGTLRLFRSDDLRPAGTIALGRIQKTSGSTREPGTWSSAMASDPAAVWLWSVQ